MSALRQQLTPSGHFNADAGRVPLLERRAMAGASGIRRRPPNAHHPYVRICLLSRLCGSFAAVNDEGLPGQKRLLAGQEQDGVSDPLRGGRALDRHAFEEVRLTLAAACEAIEHLALERPRRPAIAAPAALSALELRPCLARMKDSRCCRCLAPPS